MGGAYIAKLQFCVMENMLEKMLVFTLQGSTLSNTCIYSSNLYCCCAL